MSDDLHFAVLFAKQEVDEDDGRDEFKTVVTFNRWRGQRADISSLGYYINQPIDRENYEEFSKLTVFQNNRLHLVVNSPSQDQTTDFFFVLNDGEV